MMLVFYFGFKRCRDVSSIQFMNVFQQIILNIVTADKYEIYIIGIYAACFHDICVTGIGKKLVSIDWNENGNSHFLSQ